MLQFGLSNIFLWVNDFFVSMPLCRRESIFIRYVSRYRIKISKGNISTSMYPNNLFLFNFKLLSDVEISYYIEGKECLIFTQKA